MQTSTDVQIGDTTYRINRLSARVGSMILAHLLPAGISGLNGLSQIPEQALASIQGYALSVCQRIEDGGVPMPIFLLPDKFVIKELEYDLVTVMTLTVASLKFNIGPFFQDSGLSQMLASLGLDLTPADSQP